jgi:hypothetical protein
MAIRIRRREFIVTLGGARQRDELFAGSQKEQISTDNEPSGAQLREVREGCFEITLGACGNDRDPRLAPARHRDHAAKAPHDRIRPPLRPSAGRMDDVIPTRPATLSLHVPQHTRRRVLQKTACRTRSRTPQPSCLKDVLGQ